MVFKSGTASRFLMLAALTGVWPSGDASASGTCECPDCYLCQDVYWTSHSGGKLQRYGCSGGGVEDVLTSLGQPRGVTIDRLNQKVYWVENNPASIRRANLDGSGVQDIVTTGIALGSPDSVALDVAGGKMYWTDGGEDDIKWANLDGSDAAVLIDLGGGPATHPDGIAVDPCAKKIYWTDRGNHVIQRANLDGSGVEVCVDTESADPVGIAIDVRTQEIYWTEETANRIKRGVCGGEAGTLIASGLDGPRGIVLDLRTGYMYWTEPDADRIRRAPMNGGSIEDIVVGNSDPWGLAIHAIADCNSNGVPDEVDITMGTSADVNTNSVPDECEAQVELWVSGFSSNNIARFQGPLGNNPGAFIDAFPTAPDPMFFVLGPDCNVYLSSYATDGIERYDGNTGGFIDSFVISENGEPNDPKGVTFGPDGHLYVCSTNTDNVLRYNGRSGDPMGPFATSPILDHPNDLAFYGSYLFVNGPQSIERFDATTGAYVDTFVPTIGFPVGGFAFCPDGNLYVGLGFEGVRRYDGETGAPLAPVPFIAPNSCGLNEVNRPICGPDGDIYVVDPEADAVYRFDGATGACMGTFASGGVLDRPFFGAFIPKDCVKDCNLNGIPDDCDLSAGSSYDCNTNGTPDECEADCNTDGVPDECEIASGASQDCNTNGVPDECDPDCNSNTVPDECDIAHDCCETEHGSGCSLNSIEACVCEMDRYCCLVEWDDLCVQLVTNGTCGSCDIDCNVNGVPDECDIASGTSQDCQPDATPDECQLENNDCNSDNTPDECESDFDADGTPDECDDDIDGDTVPNDLDVCDYTPPGHTPVLDPESCLYGTLRGDYDGDCDVDLADYFVFAADMTGPNPSP